MSFEMNADVFDSLQSASFNVAYFDDDNEIFVYLGEDDYVNVSADGKVRSNFNGKWTTLKGVPLPVEIIDSTDEYEILGSIPCSNIADTLVRNALNLKNGDKITPVYEANSFYSDKVAKFSAYTFIYKSEMKIEDKPLDDGNYVQNISFKDIQPDASTVK